MPKVNFTYALKRFFPSLEPMHIPAGNIRELLLALESRYEGINAYLVDDQGRLRQHVNIFVNGELIKDRDSLSDQLSEDMEVFIMQALSGG